MRASEIEPAIVFIKSRFSAAESVEHGDLSCEHIAGDFEDKKGLFSIGVYLSWERFIRFEI